MIRLNFVIPHKVSKRDTLELAVQRDGSRRGNMESSSPDGSGEAGNIDEPD
jgi:hypothetical protein